MKREVWPLIISIGLGLIVSGLGLLYVSGVAQGNQGALRQQAAAIAADRLHQAQSDAQEQRRQAAQQQLVRALQEQVKQLCGSRPRCAPVQLPATPRTAPSAAPRTGRTASPAPHRTPAASSPPRTPPPPLPAPRPTASASPTPSSSPSCTRIHIGPICA